MRYELKSIPLWPVTKIAFFVNLIVGFLVGIMCAMFLIPFVAVLSNIVALETGEFDMEAAPIGVLMMIVPFFSALSSAFFGTMGIVIVVLVYNLIARMTGGLELNLEQFGLQTAAPVQSRSATMAATSVPAGPPPPLPANARPEPPPPISQPPAAPPPPPTTESAPPPSGSTGPEADRRNDEDATL